MLGPRTHAPAARLIRAKPLHYLSQTRSMVVGMAWILPLLTIVDRGGHRRLDAAGSAPSSDVNASRHLFSQNNAFLFVYCVLLTILAWGGGWFGLSRLRSLLSSSTALAYQAPSDYPRHLAWLSNQKISGNTGKTPGPRGRSPLARETYGSTLPADRHLPGRAKTQHLPFNTGR